MFDITYDSKGIQPQLHAKNEHIGMGDTQGRVEVFLLDEENLERYQNHQRFDCYEYSEDEAGSLQFQTANQDWYLVFRNPGRHTDMRVALKVEVAAEVAEDIVEISTPNTTIFARPLFPSGTVVNISGVASDEVMLVIDEEPVVVPVMNSYWSYLWNTSGLPAGEYVLSAECGAAQDDMTVEIVDAVPPMVEITAPENGVITQQDILLVQGWSRDNIAVDRVEVAFDEGGYQTATGTDSWSVEVDISDLSLGDHQLIARAVDQSGLCTSSMIRIAVNETGQVWGPNISTVFHSPEDPTNTSNIIIYANVTQGSPYSISHVLLYCDNGSTVTVYDLFRYADNPIQPRHEEDPLVNESNDPLYGYELGQLPTGTSITYWVTAVDTANNTQVSETSFVEVT
jgi:hypothetical protein